MSNANKAEIHVDALAAICGFLKEHESEIADDVGSFGDLRIAFERLFNRDPTIIDYDLERIQELWSEDHP